MQKNFILFFVISFVQSEPVEKVYVNGIDGYHTFNSDHDQAGKKLTAFFYGRGNETNFSWCVDCENAMPYLDEALEKFGQNTIMLYIDAGDKKEWRKKEKNRLRWVFDLKFLPTLIRLNGFAEVKRLEDINVKNPEMLESFFTD